jgi:molybdopterin-guanine dinucleotide biosynthesis protein A
MADFDHKGADIISDCRNNCSIGSPVDGINDVVGPIVALLEVLSACVLGEFVREHVFFAACDVSSAITEIGAAGE